MSHLREYKIYKGMKGRCFNPNLKEYRYYGGRGLTIAPEWLGPQGFQKFIDHIGMCPDKSMSIERIDVNKGYEPGNVKWATNQEQHQNRREFKALGSYHDVQIIAEYEARFGFREYGMTSC
jgi:hypothetical protein